jgi:tetratricopeptide (TPR) repeat protein
MRAWVLLLALGLGWAQKSKITSAALAVQDGEFEKALGFLQQAFAQPDLLKPKDMAKGYTLQAKAYMGLLLGGKDPQAVLAKYPNLLEEVVLAIRKARQYDTSKEYETDLKLVSAQASSVLYLKGFELFQKEKLPEARQHLTWALELYELIGQKEFYPPYALRGLVQLQLRDTAAAIKDLETARSLAAKKPIPNDPTLPFVYSGLISAYGGQNNAEKALEVANEGRTKFPTDENIRRTEFNLYIQNPTLQARVLERFRQEVARDPKNELYLLIYAQLW